jgi:hypothetical protein
MDTNNTNNGAIFVIIRVHSRIFPFSILNSKATLIKAKAASEYGRAQGIEAEFGRKSAKLERIARFLRSKNAPQLYRLI